MRRVLVVGGGFFGRHVARRLAEAGAAPVVASRSGAGVRMDAEDDGSIRAVLRRGDVIVDTAGPFERRSTRLVRAAMEIGCDVVDIAESLAWSEALLALAGPIAGAGIRVYPACSAIAAVTGACVVASAIERPREIDQYLAPASAETASPAVVTGFLRSLGTPIRTFRDGRVVAVRGHVDSSAFPDGRRRGARVESAATALLPRSWPSLARVDLWVDPNVPLGHRALTLAARTAPTAAAARWIARHVPVPGRRDGLFAVRIHDGGHEASFAFAASRASYLVAVEPSVVVASRLARGDGPPAGVVLPRDQVDPDELFARLRRLGIAVDRV